MTSVPTYATGGHHKHSQYLVENSEIFGLTRDDIQVISNVVRFHRKRAPNPGSIGYLRLSRRDRLRVLKLAAILRVADALDRGHMGRVEDFTIEREENRLNLKCRYSGDIAIERAGVSEKRDLFEEVFGLRVVVH